MKYPREQLDEILATKGQRVIERPDRVEATRLAWALRARRRATRAPVEIAVQEANVIVRKREQLQ